jgi:hypothetical protein
MSPSYQCDVIVQSVCVWLCVCVCVVCVCVYVKSDVWDVLPIVRVCVCV